MLVKHGLGTFDGAEACTISLKHFVGGVGVQATDVNISRVVPVGKAAFQSTTASLPTEDGWDRTRDRRWLLANGIHVEVDVLLILLGNLLWVERITNLLGRGGPKRLRGVIRYSYLWLIVPIVVSSEEWSMRSIFFVRRQRVAARSRKLWNVT